jgi:hypothetical protein
MDFPEAMINVVLPALIAVAVASRGFHVDESYVDRWVASANVQLSGQSRETVRRYLTWSRRLRTVGALIGFLVPFAYVRLTGGRDNGWELPLMLVGYLLGAAIAEVVFNRPRRQAGSALLVPRRLDDYLPAYVIILQRGLAIACVAAALVYATFPHDLALGTLPDPLRSFRSVGWLASSLGLVAFGVLGVLLAGGIEWLQRMIIGRPQPAVGANELEVDDAMRSSSLHVLAGAGIGLLLNVLAVEVSVFLAALTPSGPSFLRWLLPVIALVLWVASIAFWIDLSKPHGFKVRRIRAQRLPA